MSATELGQTTALVSEDESPLDTLQRIDHLSDAELGVVTRDTICGEHHYYRYVGDEIWVEYVRGPEGRDDVHAHTSDVLPDRLSLGGIHAIAPVEAMPQFGDDSLDTDALFADDGAGDQRDTQVSATLHFDGASRGNPGPAASGFALTVEDAVPITDGQPLGDQTNNYAEYHSLLDGIRRAREEGVTDLSIRGDSELVVRQVTGDYDCNDDDLSELLAEIREELDALDQWSIEHVPREQNSTADGVANDVLDASQ